MANNMKIVDNRYRIEKLIDKDISYDYYLVTDLLDGNTQKVLTFFEYNGNEEIVDFFIENFLEFSQCEHKNLKRNLSFNLVHDIDSKPTKAKLYYVISEYVLGTRLSLINENLTREEREKIFGEILDAIEYLHFRGVIYGIVNPDEIFIKEDKSAKLVDVGNALFKRDRRDYDDETKYYISPELLINKEKYDATVDYYSLEALYKFMFGEEKTIEEIQELYKDRSAEDLIKTRDKLYYQGKIVGRDKQIEALIGKSSKGRSTIISGNYGIGKSRFLQEIHYRLTMKGENAYIIRLKNERIDSLDFLSGIADAMSGEAFNKRIKEYNRDLNNLINSNNVSEGARFKFYNRIGNLLNDLSKENKIYLMFDDFLHASSYLVESLDYLLRILNSDNVIFYITYNFNTISEQNYKVKKIKEWENQGLVEILDLPELTVDEVGERIKGILGINYKPVNFASIIYRESKGNPRYIKQIIRYLYEQGEIYMGAEGKWKVKADEYSQITFPPVQDSDFEKQLQSIVDEYYEYFMLLSICDETVPKEWLLHQIKEKKSTIEANLKILMDKGLLLEEKSPFGYSYRTKNYELKRSIYAMIPAEEKKYLHGDLAEFLMNNFSMNDFNYLEMSIYHLSKAGQGAKAYEIIKEQVKAPANQKGPILRFLWERAHFLEFEKTPEIELEILDNLLRVQLTGSDPEKSRVLLEEYGKIAMEAQNIHHMANYKRWLIDIYMTASEIDKVEEIIKEMEEKSALYNCHRGVIIANMTRAKLQIDEGNNDGALKYLEKAKEISIEKNEPEFLHVIHNRMGLAKYFAGHYEEAERLFLQAMEEGKAIGDIFETTRPLNNLANMYAEVYEDHEKAKRYYNQGLEIALEHDFPEAVIIFSVNLSESYIEAGEYEVALGYLKDVETGAAEQQDFLIGALANINMGFVYLTMNRFDKAFEIFERLRANQTESKVRNLEILSQYYEFLGLFYTTIGNMYRGYKYNKKAYALAREYNVKSALRIKTVILFQRAAIKKIYDKEGIEEIRNEFRVTELKSDRKRTLSMMALIPLLHEDRDYARELLRESNQIECLNPDPRGEITKEVAFCMFEDEKEKVLECLLKADKELPKGNSLRKMLFKAQLGFELFAAGDDKQALLCLFESIDICYGLALQIPYKEHRYKFLRFSELGKMKNILLKIIERNYNALVKFPELNTERMENLPESFDLSPIIDAIGIENFLKLYQPEYYGDAVDIKNVEQLVAGLAQDSAYNVDLILKFMARISFAKKAIIVGYNHHKNVYFNIASLSKGDEYDFNANLLKFSRDTGGLIIDAGADYEIKGIGKYLGDGVKSIMVVPINEPESVEKEKGRDRRVIKGRRRVNLYLYFETDSVFNRMNQEILKTIQNLTKLLLINLDSMRYENIASTDKLTNTFTRKYFDLKFRELSELAVAEELPYSVLMLDIDKFKSINDVYGHKKGDTVLAEVGEILRNSTRNTDLVGRYGGEEFIIILRDADKKDALAISERIRHEISKHKFSEIDAVVTVSIGVSHFPKDGEAGDDLIEKADQALYNAKEDGRNRVQEWKKGMLMGRKRQDKLASIIQGDSEQDNRNLLSLIETMELIEGEDEKDEKAMTLLTRLFEATGAQQGAMLLFENDQLIDIFAANHGEKRKLYSFGYNKEIVQEVLESGEGKCLIDWDLINFKKDGDQKPDWQSLIVVPLIKEGRILGVLYLSVNLSKKEFKDKDFNLVRAFSSIGAAIL